MPSAPRVPLRRVGSFLVDPARNHVQVADRTLALEPKVMDVLVMLLERPGEVVSRDELIERVWGVNYPADESLTRSISILRRVFRTGDDTTVYIETISKRGYRLAQSVEVVPAVDSGGDAPAVAPEQASAPPATIVLAVLAFDNLSAESDMAYFSDGVSEEILQTIAQGTHLKVIGRASSFRFRGIDKAAANVAAQLGVTHVLDGTVRRVGERIRIYAELSECEGGTVVWSRRFERDMPDPFTIQEDIAAAVADALRIAFAPPKAGAPVGTRAHDLYLKARAQLDRQFGTRGMLEALPLYEAAVEAAPDFARAWALLAQARAYVLRALPEECPPGVTRASVVEAAATALRIDDCCGIAYLALNGLEAWASFVEREAHLDRALAVAPNDPEIIMAAANLASRTGRIRVALAYAEKAYELDPLFPVAGFYRTTMMTIMGRYEESRALSDHLLESFPDVEYMWVTALLYAAQNADWTRWQTIADRLKITGLADRLQPVIAVTQAMRGHDQAFTDAFVARARSVVEKGRTLDLRAFTAMYQLGACEEAFDIFERASFAHLFDSHARPPGGWTNETMLFNQSGERPMVRDPRFVEVCKAFGLAEYWVQSGNWPDCAEDDVLPYDFRSAIRSAVAVPRSSVAEK